MPSRATLAQVADVATVSVSTASRVLAGRGEYSPRTRARVWEAARQLGYTRHGETRGRPRAGTSLLFDLVLTHFHDPWADEVTAGARVAAAAAGYDLVLTAERDTPDDDWPARIRARGSAGTVLGLIPPTSRQLSGLVDAGIPVVLLDPRADESLPLVSVRTTDRAGGRAAAEHLVSRGAQRFMVVSGTPSYRFGRARAEGFINTVRELVPTARIDRVAADWSAPGARAATIETMRDARADGPLGVFACSDEMAAGVYAAAADLALSIPHDVLVVGFDDVRGARWLTPGLTTIRQPIREMAAEAVRVLEIMASGGELAERRIELPTTLVVRGSTGR